MAIELTRMWRIPGKYAMLSPPLGMVDQRARCQARRGAEVLMVTGASRPSFAQLLNRYRVAAGMTQEAPAEKAGLSVRGVSDLECGPWRLPQHDVLESLAGEPGIGKSRLPHDAIYHAGQQGWRVLAGGYTRSGGQKPYAPLLRALQQYIPGSPPAQRRTHLVLFHYFLWIPLGVLPASTEPRPCHQRGSRPRWED